MSGIMPGYLESKATKRYIYGYYCPTKRKEGIINTIPAGEVCPCCGRLNSRIHPRKENTCNFKIFRK